MSPAENGEPEYLKAYYVAYGRHLNIQEMISRCPDALLIRLDRLYDFKLCWCGDDDGKSSLTIRPCPGSSVPVAIWMISKNDRKALDAIEKVPFVYERTNFVLHSSPCFTYIMDPRYAGCAPNEEYLRLVEQGYRDMGFDLLDLNCARFR